MKRVICSLLLASVTTVCWARDFAQAQKRPRDLTELGLEELMNIEVTSVSKREQRLSEAAAAIYVITQEDIHRSGATSIAEALRLAPGLNVARIDSNKWAISSRGFNDFFANKLLVLMDGRSVYTPLFSGVFWDVQDTLLEDVDRIEVIRGPAGTLWGANAVNGVINIITKRAEDTQGGLVSAGGGNEERGFGDIRYGGKLGDNAYYRAYAKYFNRDDFVDASGNKGADGWQVGRGGFRFDWNLAASDSLTVQGDYYDGEVGANITTTSLSPPFARPVIGDFPISGGNILGRWKRSLSSTSGLLLQLYYDRTERKSPVHREARDTVDLEFQHTFVLGRRHEIVWGLGYRFTSDQIDPSPTVSFTPSSRGDNLFSAFVQDEITLVEKRLRLTLGSKFEHNDYTGFEAQPNARLLWTPDERHSIWAAISRAVRTPARFEHTVRANLTVFPGPSPVCPVPLCETSLFGDERFKSEELLAYELGYRAQLTQWLSLDIATFYNVYSNLRTIEPTAPFFEGSPFPPHLVLALRPENRLDGETYGVEIASTLNVTDHWKLNLGYTFLKIRLDRDASSLDSAAENPEGESPRNQFHVRSYVDLPYNVRFDTAVYYVDSLPQRNVPSYIRVDARLGWYPVKGLEVSVAAQNLFDDRHPEFGPGFLVTPTQIERSVYGKVTWRF